MATCDQCGTMILFGGVKAGGARFCNARCHRAAAQMAAQNLIPAGVVEEHLARLHQGPCPRCAGPGPVDVHMVHSVYSFVILTRWSSAGPICCVGCGRKAKWGAAGLCLLTGWWGFPWGLVLTPIQITRNLKSLSQPDPAVPSERLRKHLRMVLYQQALQNDSPDVPPRI